MNFNDLREPVNAWTHLFGLVMAAIGTLTLWHRSRGRLLADRLSLVVFGACLISCYAASALYHGVRLPPDQLDVFDRLDHIGIFLLIAGSYTPLAWCLLRGRWRIITLSCVWFITTAASTLLAVGLPMSSRLGTGLYLALGWGSVICYAELAKAVAPRALRPLVVGGLLYSVGATINLLGWPTLVPGLFGAHEVFHLFVLAGSFVHYRLILTVVVPFEQMTSKIRVAGVGHPGFGVS